MGQFFTNDPRDQVPLKSPPSQKEMSHRGMRSPHHSPRLTSVPLMPDNLPKRIYLSGYFLWVGENRDSYIEKNVDMSTSDLDQMMAKTWSDLAECAKHPYREAANRALAAWVKKEEMEAALKEKMSDKEPSDSTNSIINLPGFISNQCPKPWELGLTSNSSIRHEVPEPAKEFSRKRSFDSRSYETPKATIADYNNEHTRACEMAHRSVKRSSTWCSGYLNGSPPKKKVRKMEDYENGDVDDRVLVYDDRSDWNNKEKEEWSVASGRSKWAVTPDGEFFENDRLFSG